MHSKRLNPNCNGNRRDKVALKTTFFKHVKFKNIKTRTSCQYASYFYKTGSHKTFDWTASGT